MRKKLFSGDMPAIVAARGGVISLESLVLDFLSFALFPGRSYFNQLTKGCGRSACTTKDCASNPAFVALSQKDALKQAVQLSLQRAPLCPKPSAAESKATPQSASTPAAGSSAGSSAAPGAAASPAPIAIGAASASASSSASSSGARAGSGSGSESGSSVSSARTESKLVVGSPPSAGGSSSLSAPPLGTPKLTCSNVLTDCACTQSASKRALLRWFPPLARTFRRCN